MLRLLGGFETPDAGRIVVAGEDVTRAPPARRRLGMVFQHYALFPHVDVGENVAFGLQRRVEPGVLEQQVSDALALVDLAGFERRKVQELSGGQQQRGALARALAPEPRVLLLDEPLSNLDPALRERTRRELRQLIQRVATPARWRSIWWKASTASGSSCRRGPPPRAWAIGCCSRRRRRSLSPIPGRARERAAGPGGGGAAHAAARVARGLPDPDRGGRRARRRGRDAAPVRLARRRVGRAVGERLGVARERGARRCDRDPARVPVRMARVPRTEDAGLADRAPRGAAAVRRRDRVPVSVRRVRVRGAGDAAPVRAGARALAAAGRRRRPAGARLLDVRLLLLVHPRRPREARRVDARGRAGARRGAVGDVAAGAPRPPRALPPRGARAPVS